MIIERYFVSYFGDFEGGVGVHSTVVMTKGKLETGRHVQDLTEYLTEKAGYPIVILSLYHMCTVEEQGGGGWLDGKWIDGILGGCEDRCCVCGRSTAGEVCQQCGKPLCSGCFETGLCSECSTEDNELYPKEEEKDG